MAENTVDTLRARVIALEVALTHTLGLALTHDPDPAETLRSLRFAAAESIDRGEETLGPSAPAAAQCIARIYDSAANNAGLADRR